jgi:hypothetical protein
MCYVTAAACGSSQQDVMVRIAAMPHYWRTIDPNVEAHPAVIASRLCGSGFKHIQKIKTVSTMLMESTPGCRL